MNAQQAENLRILIRHMEGSTVAYLDMFNPTPRCGTACCAMGHAKTLKTLKARGLQRNGLEDEAVRFFGMDGHEPSEARYWGRLFGASLIVRGIAPWPFGHRHISKPTPHEWAAEARKVLRENGYDMLLNTPEMIERMTARNVLPLRERIAVYLVRLLRRNPKPPKIATARQPARGQTVAGD